MQKSIKAKIILGLLVVITIAVGVIFTVTMSNISTLSHQAFNESTAKELKQVDRTVTLFLEESKRNSVLMSLNPLVRNVDETLTTYKDKTEPSKAQPRSDDLLGQQIMEFLALVKDSHPAYVEVYMGTKWGGFVEAKPIEMPAGYDPSIRPWFKEAAANPDAPIVSSAYMSTNGEATISIAKAVKRGNEVVAVTSMDINLSGLTNMVKAIKIGRTGYVMLFQDDGTILANPADEDTNFKKADELDQQAYAEVFAKESGTVNVMMGGTEYVANVYTSPELGWKFVGLISQAEIMEPVYANLKVQSIIFVICLIGIGVFIWIFVDRTAVRPLHRVSGFLDLIGAGDYSQRLNEKRADEIGTIYRSLNSMAVKLDENIKLITTKSEEAEEKARAAEEATVQAREALEQAKRARAEGMLHAAERLESVVNALSDASGTIARQAEAIREGTDTQRERLAATSTAMEEMNATVLEVAQNASNAADQGTAARDKAQRGADVVRGSIDAMDTTQKQAEALNEDMAQLDQQAKAIGNIMTVIEDIADQTNLLALNAAIEAARAGEAGRGFAVVADEVRKLAEKTMQATKEVGASIVSIQKVAANNVAAMRHAVDDLEKATGLANESGQALAEIVEGTQQSAVQIQSIATAAEQQSAASEEITSAIEEINAIAMETAASVSDATAALEDLAIQSAQLAELIRELKEEGKS